MPRLYSWAVLDTRAEEKCDPGSPGSIQVALRCQQKDIPTDMHHELRDNQLYLQRLPEEKEHLIQRLNRIEGQVRGLRRMIENDRYSVDMVQQTSAISAATREVTLLLIQHLETDSVGVGEWRAERSPQRGDTRYCSERHRSSTASEP